MPRFMLPLTCMPPVLHFVTCSTMHTILCACDPCYTSVCHYFNLHQLLRLSAQSLTSTVNWIPPLRLIFTATCFHALLFCYYRVLLHYFSSMIYLSSTLFLLPAPRFVTTCELHTVCATRPYMHVSAVILTECDCLYYPLLSPSCNTITTS